MTKRKLTVTSCNIAFDPPDKDWTLYEVAVLDEAGDPIDANFKSFDNLPIGQLIEFEVEKREHEKYGVSYSLKPPPSVARGLKPNITGDIAELRQRIARLESQVGALGVSPGAEPASPSPAMASMDPAGVDDDIPF